MKFGRLSSSKLSLIMPVGFLVVISLLTLGSVASSTNLDFELWQHGLGLGIGLILGILAMMAGKDAWFRLATPLYIVNIALLVLVLLIGEVVQGSQRWLDLGALQFQPSEMMKFSLILLQAKLIANRGKKINSFEGFGLSLFYLVVPMGLVMLQPDLGTAMVYLLVWGAMIAVSQFGKIKVVLALMALVAAVPLSFPLLEDYQQDRLTSFLSSGSDLSGQGYNVRQAQIAIGSGGWTGQGFAAGTQSQLEFLPSQHTDFIFAVTTEKIGFIGAMLIIFAFVFISARLLWFGWLAQSDFAKFALIGAGALIAVEFIINIGMNLGLAPVTGLPLPFVSYGGSHVIYELLLLGFCLGLVKAH